MKKQLLWDFSAEAHVPVLHRRVLLCGMPRACSLQLNCCKRPHGSASPSCWGRHMNLFVCHQVWVHPARLALLCVVSVLPQELPALLAHLSPSPGPHISTPSRTSHSLSQCSTDLTKKQLWKNNKKRRLRVGISSAATSTEVSVSWNYSPRQDYYPSHDSGICDCMSRLKENKASFWL